ncbi:hypothetical protein V6237_12545 [Pseudoalteromonas carrageenovora]|uniref:hypothetical protein n=1 Tax=Pseudoalteromonas carrageenovora TaxID=227 RepID=UPI00311E25D1
MAPFVVFPALLVAFLILYSYSLATGYVVSTTGFEAWIVMTFVGWLLAAFLTLFYGLPIALLLQHFNKFKLRFLLPLSLVPTFIVLLTSKSELGVLFIYAYSSAIVSVAYWFIFTRKKFGE